MLQLLDESKVNEKIYAFMFYWLSLINIVFYYSALLAGFVFVLRKEVLLGYCLIILACVDVSIVDVVVRRDLNAFALSVSTGMFIVVSVAVFAKLVHWRSRSDKYD